MEKLLAAVLFVILSAIALIAPPASAQTPCAGPDGACPPSVPTVNTPPNFAGTWILSLYGVSLTDANGMRQEFPYAELKPNFIGGVGDNNGSMYASGDVRGFSGSSSNIYYNPATPRYVEMYLYIPEPSLGSGSQYYLQISIRMFISPDGSYLYGTMTAAFYDNLNSTGNSVPTILYQSDVFMSRQGARG